MIVKDNTNGNTMDKPAKLPACPVWLPLQDLNLGPTD
jgi:hypothetical protein